MDSITQQRKYAKGLAVRDRIIAAACLAFAARGYAGCSVAELAAAAKVSRNQLFHHFGSKENVALACIERAQQAFSNEITLPAEIYPQPTNRLVFVFDRLAELHANGWEYNRLLASLAAQRAGLPDDVLAALNGLLAELAAFFRRQFKEAKREGGLAHGGKARVLSGYMLALLLGLPALDEVAADGAADVLRLAQSLCLGEAAGADAGA